MHSWLSGSAWIVFSIKQISRKGREKNPCNSCGLVVYYVVRIIYSVCSIGWGLSEALATRLLPLWFGARGTEFNWKYIQSSFECNINLVSIFQDIFEYVSNLCYIDLSIFNMHIFVVMESSWCHQVTSFSTIIIVYMLSTTPL